jgi:general stress protein 26
MIFSKNKNMKSIECLITLLIIVIPLKMLAQNVQSPSYDPDTLITAAREIMQSARYCALITLDKSGHPQVRTMDPFPPEDDMVVWLGTNLKSRKVKEIQNDPRTCLYYEAPDGSGYVVLKGHAFLFDDRKRKQKYWKEEWSEFYSDRKANYTLIKIIPDIIEVVDYRHGIVSKSETWAVPFVKINK